MLNLCNVALRKTYLFCYLEDIFFWQFVLVHVLLFKFFCDLVKF